jgi:shikimate kinase / 3-dehydroquinate synthase
MARANIALAGFMGSGKTTAGRIISELTGMSFIDTDEVVEVSSGMSVQDIFARGGEELFRQIERQVVIEASSGSNRVIALGGGAVLDPDNIESLRKNSVIYYLDVTIEEALTRATPEGGRPLLGDRESARELLDSRRDAYLEAADLVVETAGRTPQEVARAIEEDFRGRSVGERTRVVHVELQERSYAIFVGHGLLEHAGRLIEPAGCQAAFVISDDSVAELYGATLLSSLESSSTVVRSFTFPHGEASKTLGTATEMIERLADSGGTRSDIVVALGGGVTGDLAGFVASMFKRGLRFAQVPTTLMAQVDSSIGGKTGVNLPHGKNLVGTFYQPAAVVCDVDVLASLPEREIRSGMAEVAKYSFLDPGGWPRLEKLFSGGELDLDAMVEVVARCASIKAVVVSEDELDTGLRAVLNYGHTLGHSLEAASGYGSVYTHGEAVSVGMVFAALVAEEIGMTEGLSRRHIEFLEPLGLPVRPVEPAPGFDEVMELITQDKKSRGDIVMILLEDEGHLVVMDGLHRDLLKSAYERLRRQA